MDGSMIEQADEVIVNKGQLADIIGCSVPHVDALMKRYPEFPVIKQGNKGVGWEFDANAVRDFLAARRAEEDAAAAAAAERRDQLRLPGVEVSGPTGLTPNQELAQVRAEKERRALAREAGFLVETAVVRDALDRSLRKLQVGLRAIPANTGRKFGLPDAVVRSIGTDVDEQLAALVREIQRDLVGDDKLEQARG
jgi:phage terminase Nu1 subunit (DNA packaging protein)